MTIQIENLSKQYNNILAVKGINFKIDKGSIVGLLGPNGCGKTSLYGCILGRYKVDNGKIFLNQKDITSLPIHERARLGIGYLSQYRSVFSMSAYDNLLAVVQLTVKKAEKQRLMVEQLLTEFNLQHLRNINANLLSGGEVRRLQIARTLINSPKVILLDEPMAALDPIVVQDIQKYILKLQAYGCGIIITEHSIQNLFQICDRATVIGEHTIIAEGKPKDILQYTKARELYFGSFDN